MARRQATPKDEGAQFVPPFYEATQDIYLGHPDSGAMPIAAYRKGDQVHPGVVEEHNLSGSVKVPVEFGGAEDTARESAPETTPVDLDSQPDTGGTETPDQAEGDGE